MKTDSVDCEHQAQLASVSPTDSSGKAKRFLVIEQLKAIPLADANALPEPSFELEFGEFVFPEQWLTNERRTALDSAVVWIASELESTEGHAALRVYANRAVLGIVVKSMHSVVWVHDWLAGWAAAHGIAYDHDSAI